MSEVILVSFSTICGTQMTGIFCTLPRDTLSQEVERFSLFSTGVSLSFAIQSDGKKHQGWAEVRY